MEFQGKRSDRMRIPQQLNLDPDMSGEIRARAARRRRGVAEQILYLIETGLNHDPEMALNAPDVTAAHPCPHILTAGVPGRCPLTRAGRSEFSRRWRLAQGGKVVAAIAIFLVFSISVQAQTIEIPFHREAGDLLSIPCKIDGGKELRCVVDTGSSRTVADPENVAIRAGAPISRTDGIGGARPMRMVQSSVEVGGNSFPLEVGILGGLRKAGLDVLLGQDFLSQFARVTLDYARGVVIFEKKAPQ